ncbi:MAG: aminoacyl-tRNA hydrolase [Pseudomonadota bacterium]|nr:aminoacyl-tRNA hydrolase [Pseudomonadota bacterium]
MSLTDYDIKLIVALGNPGSKYEATRHNAGIWFLSKIAERLNAKFTATSSCKAEIAEVCYEGRAMKLMRPLVYMNNNGQEISKYMRYFKLKPSQLLVIHDELDFLPGIIRFKLGGGCAGHNGLKSIKEHLGSTNFLRLRIGIGHPGTSAEVSEYVLSKPKPGERSNIDNAIDESMLLLDYLFTGDIQTFMQNLHT